MRIHVNNLSAFAVDLCLNNNERFTLDPHQDEILSCDITDSLLLNVCLHQASTYRNSIYNLILESDYIFHNIDDDVNLVITREKIRVSLYVSYERVFVRSEKGYPVSESIHVKDEAEIKKLFHRNQRLKLVYGPLVHFPALCIVLSILGVALASLIDWRLLLVYFPCAYAFLFGLHWFIDTIWSTVSKKAFKMNEQDEFYEQCTPTHLSSYYAQPIRDPFMGKVDRK